MKPRILATFVATLALAAACRHRRLRAGEARR
jgi:hypothetical protein